MARNVPEIPTASMADIAFMLLIFFLVATTMDVDSGLSRILPPMPEEEKKDDSRSGRGIFPCVLMHRICFLLKASLKNSNLRDRAKEFIANPNDEAHLPEKIIEGS
jgi:biopolymer transport protein ExbD